MIKTLLFVTLTSLMIPSVHHGTQISELFSIDMNHIEEKNEIFYADYKIKISKKDFNCLAQNIFYESGIESYEGKLAVAQVTYNRLKSGRWGKSFCKVIYAPKQFSWTNQKKKPPKGELWEESKLAAKNFINGARLSSLIDSTHYHADWIKTPKWAKNIESVDEIGQHIFYVIK